MRRKIKGILSERAHDKYRSFQIVTKWEDIISEELNLPIVKVKQWYFVFFRRINRLKLSKLFLFFDSIRPVKNYYLYHYMEVTPHLHWTGIKNIIPIIIDFWLKEKDLKEFYRNYRNCKLILITSKEVLSILENDNCPLPIVHFPLSIPDEDAQMELPRHDKAIDFLFAGRTDPVFWDYIIRYELENPNIEYVYQELDGFTPFYVSNKRGKLNEDFFKREEYIKLLKNSKIAFYTTPGNDPTKEGANGYNQVTPRFFELLANGCFVLGRYTDNPDVRFYEIENLCPNISNYEEFKFYVEQYLNKDYAKKHLKKYPEFLTKHTTKQRALLLERILIEHKFSIN